MFGMFEKEHKTLCQSFLQDCSSSLVEVNLFAEQYLMLKDAVNKTDNDIDDAIVKMIEEKLFPVK